MSNTPRQYLYTAEDVYGKAGLDDGMSRDEIWHAYEAERAKDAELIQMAVNACTDPHKMSLSFPRRQRGKLTARHCKNEINRRHRVVACTIHGNGIGFIPGAVFVWSVQKVDPAW